MSLSAPRLVLASNNAGKLAEFRRFFADSGITVLAQAELGVADIPETGLTFIENALLKARHAAQATGLPALADDSGLCVDVLGGAPGLYSARYAGGHGDARANNDKLLRELADVPDARRGAHFHCTLALLQHANDPAPLVAEGRWHGRVLHAPRGEHGFGYDPLFLDPESGLSASELSPAEKNRVSHRGLAIVALRRLLAETGAGSLD